MSARDVVKIEQRLQDQPRIALLSLDEAMVVGFPLVLGMLSRHLFASALLAVVFWQLWKRMKGEGGLQWVLAALYWYCPAALSPFRTLPDSAIERWRG